VSDLAALRLAPTSFPSLAELNTLVLVPGKPGAAKAFTDAEVETGEAAEYASEQGGCLQPFPLDAPPPA
jgi:hypothetical protein